MIINLTQLNRANRHVTNEMESLGLWSSRLNGVDVWLVPFSWDCYGWQEYGSDGSICIPRISLVRLGDFLLGRPGYTLRDVMRHEWAHAVAYHHHDLVSKKSFKHAFDGDHDGNDTFAYDSEIHISRYAAKNPSEDFAENVMHYIRCRGVLPRKWQTPAIANRWQFINGLSRHVRRL